MAASGYTPISLYYSTTASAVPLAANLTAGELALNTTDEKLYFKNASGTVKLLASNAASATSGTSILYGNGSGGFSNVTIGSGISFAGGTLSATGTGGTVTSVALSGGTTGLTVSGSPITTSGTITLAGTVATTNGGTGLTSFTANGVVYASSTSALATGSALTFDGTNFTVANGDLTVATNGKKLYVNYIANNSGSDLNINGATNQIFAITGSEQMRLTSTGLGIGTSSPDQKLTIVGNQKITGYIELRSANKVYFDDSTNAAAGAIWNNTSGTAGLAFSGDGTTAHLQLNSSGNLGVGLTPVANNGILQLNSYASVQALMEKATVSATAATGTINFDAATQAVLYYTTNASGNWTINIRGNSGLSLNSMMQTGQSLTLAFLATNGATAYYQSALTVDGSSVTPKWQGGTAPTTGNASAVDAYVLTVIKTGSATFTVLASQTKFA